MNSQRGVLNNPTDSINTKIETKSRSKLLGFQNELRAFAKSKFKISFVANQENMVTEYNDDSKNEVNDLKCIAVALRKNKKSVDNTNSRINRMQSSILMDTTNKINVVNQNEGLTARNVVEKKLIDKKTLKTLIEK